MADVTRVRCCRANDRAEAHKHLRVDMAVPCSADVLRAVSAVQCPCGWTTMLLADDAPEPWEPGGYDPEWEKVLVETKAQDDAENALPPDDVVEPEETGDLAEQLRDERARRIDAEAGWDRASDIARVLASAVRNGHREAGRIAAGILAPDAGDVSMDGVRAPIEGKGIAMGLSTHWATYAMAANFGRSLGKAVNYIEMRMDDLAAPGGRRCYVVSIQRAEGKTPHDLRVKAEAERDAAVAATAESCVKDCRAVQRRYSGRHEDAADAVDECVDAIRARFL